MFGQKSPEEPSYKSGGYSKPKRSPIAYRQWQPPAQKTAKSGAAANEDNNLGNRSVKESGTAAD